MKTRLLTVLALVLGANLALADCDAPAEPEIPDGASATLEDMLAGQKAVKTFQAANADYLACLEKAYEKAAKAASKGSDDAKAAAEADYKKGLDAYNAAVAKEEDVAGQFNTEIREYKAANPG